MIVTGDGVSTVTIEDLDEGDIVNLVEALKDSSERNAERASLYKYDENERYVGNEHLRWEDIAFAYSQAAAMARLAHELMWEYDCERKSMGWVAK